MMKCFIAFGWFMLYLALAVSSVYVENYAIKFLMFSASVSGLIQSFTLLKLLWKDL